MDRRLLLRFLATSPLLLAGPAFAGEQVLPRRKPAILTAPKAKPLPPRTLPLLMLDAGHGGHDPGAIGVSGTQEKDITLDLARKVADALNGQVRVALTRDKDIFIPLPERVAMARAKGAHLFVSLHADSAPDNTNARGLSAYTLSATASDSFSQKLADSENLVDQKYGATMSRDPIIADIMHDLAADQTVRASRFAKEALIKGVAPARRLLDNPSRSANFAVLRAPDMPAMLIETGFLSNPDDERLLKNPQDRATLAKVIARELGAILQNPLFT